MASKFPVPSKDAIQVLRRLAYGSTSTINASTARKPLSDISNGRRLSTKASLSHRSEPRTENLSFNRPQRSPVHTVPKCLRHQSTAAATASTQAHDYEEKEILTPWQSWHEVVFKNSGTAEFEPFEFLDSMANRTWQPKKQQAVIDLGLYQTQLNYSPDRRLGSHRRAVLSCLRKNGTQAAEEKLKSIMMQFVETRIARDWTYCKLLHLHMRQHLRPDTIRRVGNDVVEAMLQQSPPRFEAISFLAVQWARDYGEDSKDLVYRRIRQYLLDFVDAHALVDEQLNEADKVLNGMRLCNIHLASEVLLPAIRSSVAAHATSEAHHFLASCYHTYGLMPSLLLWNEIARGYGMRQDWSSMDKLFAWLHREGFSRSKPIAYCQLVEIALTRHVQYNPDTRIYDYLSYIVQEAGLIPSAKLSNLIYCKFVQSQRYDLAQKWTRAQRLALPEMIGPAGTARSAHEIASVWAKVKASSHDILLTCKALAHGAIRDPFSDHFRYLAKEAISYDLIGRCQSHARLSGHDTQNWNPNAFANVFEVFHSVHAYLHTASSSTERALSGSARRLHRQEILKQLQSAREAVLLLEDISSYMTVYGPDVKIEVGDTQRASIDDSRLDLLLVRQKAVKWNSLKGVSDLISELDYAYARREARDESIDSSVLLEAINALLSEDRYFHISLLLLNLSNTSRAPKIFDEEVFTIWFTATTKLGSHRHRPFVQALWALLDLSTVTVSSRLLLHLRLRRSVLAQRERANRLALSKQQHRELEYLTDRIYARKWHQIGCPKIGLVEEPYLRAWLMRDTANNEKARSRRNAVVLPTRRLGIRRIIYQPRSILRKVRLKGTLRQKIMQRQVRQRPEPKSEDDGEIETQFARHDVVKTPSREELTVSISDADTTTPVLDTTMSMINQDTQPTAVAQSALPHLQHVRRVLVRSYLHFRGATRDSTPATEGTHLKDLSSPFSQPLNAISDPKERVPNVVAIQQESRRRLRRKAALTMRRRQDKAPRVKGPIRFCKLGAKGELEPINRPETDIKRIAILDKGVKVVRHAARPSTKHVAINHVDIKHLELPTTVTMHLPLNDPKTSSSKATRIVGLQQTTAGAARDSFDISGMQQLPEAEEADNTKSDLSGEDGTTISSLIISSAIPRRVVPTSQQKPNSNNGTPTLTIVPVTQSQLHAPSLTSESSMLPQKPEVSLQEELYKKNKAQLIEELLRLRTLLATEQPKASSPSLEAAPPEPEVNEWTFKRVRRSRRTRLQTAPEPSSERQENVDSTTDSTSTPQNRQSDESVFSSPTENIMAQMSGTFLASEEHDKHAPENDAEIEQPADLGSTNEPIVRESRTIRKLKGLRIRRSAATKCLGAKTLKTV